MSFMEKVKQTLRSFMNGRYGIDQLSNALVIVGLVLYLLDAFIGTGILSMLGLVAYILAFIRIFSRNIPQRRAENQRYLAKYNGVKSSLRQARMRFVNRKQYKYFKCPSCRTWIRLKRNTGNVTIHCNKCGHDFDQSA